jgi:hypothetical protein
MAIGLNATGRRGGAGRWGFFFFLSFGLVSFPSVLFLCILPLLASEVFGCFECCPYS